MNIRIEDSGGKRTYYVNDIPYTRLEDIPEEYRSYFADTDNNGMPDQFDSMMKLATGKAGFKQVVSTLASELTNMARDEAGTIGAAERNDFRDDGRTRSSFPTYIKVLFFLAIGILIVWLIISRMPETSETPVEEIAEQPVAVEESAAAEQPLVATEPEAEVAEEAVNPDAFRFVAEDPNEPPYRMFVNVFRGNTFLFAFDVPDGALMDTGSDRLAVDLEVPQGTTLSAAVFDVTILTDQCLSEDADWTARQVGATEFQTALVSDSGAGHSYNTYYYVFKGAYCAQFSLTLNSVNAIVTGATLKEYNPANLIGVVEDVLRTMRFE